MSRPHVVSTFSHIVFIWSVWIHFNNNTYIPLLSFMVTVLIFRFPATLAPVLKAANVSYRKSEVSKLRLWDCLNLQRLALPGENPPACTPSKPRINFSVIFCNGYLPRHSLLNDVFHFDVSGKDRATSFAFKNHIVFPL